MQGINNLINLSSKKLNEFVKILQKQLYKQNENNRKLDTAISVFSEQYAELNNNLNQTNENVLQDNK
jgi:hypothetical protein